MKAQILSVKIILCIFILNVNHAIAQSFVPSNANNSSGVKSFQPQGGKGINPAHQECVTNSQRVSIEKMLDSNKRMLINKGLLPDYYTTYLRPFYRPMDHSLVELPFSFGPTTPTKFDWPLHQVIGSYYSCYGIANYVDLNPAYPGDLLDWNCGARTYDLSTGYNHAGTDIILWPFDWNMMENEQVEIIAAAPGTIIGKSDGNYDHDCGIGDTTEWNAVYIQHSDGTVAWYGHMKTGTTTSKSIGDTVALGEHLGFVGSSGSSTAPHLHFEVHDSLGDVRDPFNGTCNSLPSLWNSQKPYYESSINTLMTHFAAPGFAPCPNIDTINARDTFAPGSTVYFAAYYHDQLAGQNTTFTIYRPDSSVYTSWSFASSYAYYTLSYWYWYFTIPASQPTGRWMFAANYQSNNYIHYFNILNLVDSITGMHTVCVGSSITLSDSSSGGTWSSGNTAKATVGSSTGIITGVSAGAVTISYTISTGIATFVVTVSATLPSAGTITGTATVCAGSTTALSDGATGGAWSSTATTVATVGSTGTVTGVSSGTATISYTVTNGCGTAAATQVVSVNPLPSAGTITGIDSLCPNDSIILSETVLGGIWGVTNNSISNISTSGSINGILPGEDTVTYSVTIAGCTTSATLPIIVRPSSDCRNGSNIFGTIQIYPNPNYGAFTFNLTSNIDEKINIIITNIIGQKIKEFNAATNKTVDIFINEPPGIYFLIATTNNKTQSVKFLLK